MPATNRSALHDTDSYYTQVKIALEHLADVEWLGAHSPLATPYILGHHLDKFAGGETILERGQTLQSLLHAAADQQPDPLLRAVIKHCFLTRDPRRTLADLADQLGVADRTFFRLQRKAISELAEMLHHNLLPTLRAETPNTTLLIGRQETLEACLKTIGIGRSVTLMGVSGTGKTTLAAAVARTWESATLPSIASSNPTLQKPIRRVFWYTLRPGFNDGLLNFIFAFGYFLRTHGAANTWRQLIADQGALQAEHLLALLRYDLHEIKTVGPLLCIDEIDTLQIELDEHAKLLYVLEELRAFVPLLLIGQRAVTETDEYYTLTGFNEVEMTLWLKQSGLADLTIAERNALYTHTRGNPAMLTLFSALLQSGDTTGEVIANLGISPSLETLFNRLWRRLSDPERILLRQLAVFRTPSPQDAWVQQQSLLHKLEVRGILQMDQRGGIYILPYLQRFIIERMPSEIRTTLHLRAAVIREDRGEYLASMYHYILNKQPAQAVWLWFSHRTAETNRGHGATALALLNQISLDDLLDPADRNTLHLARAELYKLLGRPEDGASELLAISPTKKDLSHVYAQELYGDLLAMQNQIEQALQHYRDALQTLTGPLQLRETSVHLKIGHLYATRLQDLEQANREALLARLKAEIFHGYVEELAGNYIAARIRFQAANELADQLSNDLAAFSLVYSHLGKLEITHGGLEQAIEYMTKAIACAEQRGDLVAPLYDRINLAFAYTLTGNCEEAYRQARQGLTVAERMRHAYLTAGLAAAAGEACCYLNRLEEAEQYVAQALEQEEEFFVPWALTVLGGVRHAQHKHDEAVRTLEESIASAQMIKDKYGEAYALTVLGNVQRSQSHWNLAQQAYQAALHLYTELGMERECTEIIQILEHLSS